MGTFDDILTRVKNIENQLAATKRNVDTFGLEYDGKFYGIYRGFVVDNKDEDQQGRILAFCPDVGHTSGTFPNVWIYPVFGAAGANRGTMLVPEIGDCVRVFFDMGNTAYPVGYLGGWFGLGELPQELSYSDSGYPEKRGFISRMGHTVFVSDEPGAEIVNITWHKADPSDPAADTTEPNNRSLTADRSKGSKSSIVITPDGSIELTANAHKGASEQSSVKIDTTGTKIEIRDENGNIITIDATGLTITDKAGNTITSNSEGIKLNSGSIFVGSSATHPIPLGDMLVQWLSQHTHTTAVGPSGPPIVPPMPSDLLSGVSKTA